MKVQLSDLTARILLGLETAVAFPFFLISWLLCGVFYAVLAGHLMARSGGEDKAKLLRHLLGKRE